VSVNNFTNTVIGRNGQNIMGAAENMTMDRAYSVAEFIYTGATYGWRLL
jgi:hypothetical protein